ncbi:hypothetical protein [Bacteroides sp.]
MLEVDPGAVALAKSTNCTIHFNYEYLSVEENPSPVTRKSTSTTSPASKSILIM